MWENKKVQKNSGNNLTENKLINEYLEYIKQYHGNLWWESTEETNLIAKGDGIYHKIEPDNSDMDKKYEKSENVEQKMNEIKDLYDFERLISISKIKSPTYHSLKTTNMMESKKNKNKTLIQTINIDGKEYDLNLCVNINRYWYLKSDKDLSIDIISGETIHKKNAYKIYSHFIVENGRAGFKDEHLVTKLTYDSAPYILSKSLSIESKILFPELIVGWKFKEDMKNGGVLIDYFEKDIPIESIKQYDQYKNIASKMPSLKGKIGDVSQTHLITEGLKYTFGVELEVNRGNIPFWMAARKYNISCIRDGSLNSGEGGAEYVTGILVGDNGLKHLQEICQLLSHRCTVDRSCGMHIHLGGINFSNEFIVNSYKLALLLEDEIFSTLPKSRRENAYCKRLKKFKFNEISSLSLIESEIALQEDYNMIFKYISYEKINNPTFEYNKGTQHPMGPKCGYNHDTPRYCWLNFVPAMFDTRGNKSYSLEVRNHQGTTSFIKARNWLLFFMGFMAFVERHPQEIKDGITMKNVIDRIFPKKSKSLNMYFDKRKDLFRIDENESGEYCRHNNNFINIKEQILE